MRNSELAENSTCALCGEVISLTDPAVYAVSESTAICTSCAQRCGGSYDPESERWKTAPKVPTSPGHD